MNFQKKKHIDYVDFVNSYLLSIRIISTDNIDEGTRYMDMTIMFHFEEKT